MALNSVHTDTNWRQRLAQEAASASAWRDQWGFLEHAKPAGSVHVDRQVPNAKLHRTIVEQGVCYPFMLKTHRENRESGQTARTYRIGGSVRTVAPLTSRGYGSGDNANAFSLALQQQALNQQQREQEQLIQRQREAEQARLTATQPLSAHNGSQSARPAPPSVDRNSGLHFSRRAPAPRRANPQLSKREQLMRAAPGYTPSAPTYSPVSPSYAPHAPTLLPPVYSAAPAATSSASIPPLNFSAAARPPTPVLHLDLEHALTLSARTLQEVGGSVWASGLDPATKYRHPLTTSHRIGWNLEDPHKTLEFFGVNQHAKNDLSLKRLYGQ